MKRDLDLCRSLMLCFEQAEPGKAVHGMNVPGVDPVTVYEHIKLLIEAQFIEGYCRVIPTHPTGGMLKIQGITWAGHDFIDTARSESVWNKTKARLKQAGSWTFSLMMDVLKDEAKQQLGDLLT